MWRHLELFVNIKYGEITGINEKTQKPHSFLSPLQIKLIQDNYRLAGKSEGGFIMGLRVHEFDRCKTAKVRVI